MNNNVSVTREPDGKINRSYSLQRRFLPAVSNPLSKNMKVIQQKQPGMLIPEWQLMDDEPDKLQNPEENNLYVTDWQMTS